MKLLALVESPGHVCCRYRIRAFATSLNDAGWSVTYEGFDQGRCFVLSTCTALDNSTPSFYSVSSCQDGNYAH